MVNKQKREVTSKRRSWPCYAQRELACANNSFAGFSRVRIALHKSHIQQDNDALLHKVDSVVFLEKIYSLLYQIHIVGCLQRYLITVI